MHRKSIKIYTIGIAIALLFSSCTFSRYFYYTRSASIKIEPNNEDYHLQTNFLRVTHSDSISYVRLAPRKGNRLKATILLVHGNGGNISTWISTAEPLVEDGYEVYIYDYRGYGYSSGYPTHQNLLDDSNMLISFIDKEKLSDKFLLWGISLGGNLSVKLAKDNSSIIDGLILEAPFSGYREIARKFCPRLVKPLLVFVSNPYPAAKTIKRVKVPLLLFHSRTDKVVPFAMGCEIYANANRPKCFVEIKGNHCDGIVVQPSLYKAKIDSLVATIVVK